VLPKYIKVGRNCTSRTNCPGGVEVYMTPDPQAKYARLRFWAWRWRG